MYDHQVKSSPSRPDNKVRLSQDVLEKADRIAAEWGLKNARAAVEAVFRRYCDDYLYGRPPEVSEGRVVPAAARPSPVDVEPAPPRRSGLATPQCEALDALDQLLAL
jgi:hypothetical protein